MYKKILAFTSLFSMLLVFVNSQALKNTSYINLSNEKVLRLEMIIPADLATTWKIFTTDEKLKTWAAPLAHIELKSGGQLITNYDSTKQLSDSSSIRLPILSYIDKELLIFKVDLNNNFVQSVRDTDENLQEIIQFIQINDKKTKVISSMIGWGKSADWDKAFNFFVRGNEWTYNELLKKYR